MPLLRQVEERVVQTWAANRRRQFSILSRFVTEAERAGGVVREVVDPQAVGFSIAALAKAQGITLCQATDRDLARDVNLEAALIEAGISLAAGPSPDGIVHAGIGVTRATAGVAETGSILLHLDEDEVDARLLSMLPEIHVALLHQDTVVDSLEEGLLLTRYLILRSSLQGRPSYCSWVTGPSRTADIERALTIGVHGPRQLHIFVLPPTGKGIGS
jgi:L-lactate dehydrogenase complex protein LldG